MTSESGEDARLSARRLLDLVFLVRGREMALAHLAFLIVLLGFRRSIAEFVFFYYGWLLWLGVALQKRIRPISLGSKLLVAAFGLVLLFLVWSGRVLFGSDSVSRVANPWVMVVLVLTVLILVSGYTSRQLLLVERGEAPFYGVFRFAVFLWRSAVWPFGTWQFQDRVLWAVARYESPDSTTSGRSDQNDRRES